MMIVRRILHYRKPYTLTWRRSTSAASFTSPSSPLRKPPRLPLSPMFAASNSFVNCSTAYNIDRCGYTTHTLADVSSNGIIDVPLAQTGEGIAECELLKWFVKEGDEVEEFQPLCEVQSDKATIEITSRYKGKVAQILYVPGNIVKVGETLLKMDVEGCEVSTMSPSNVEKIKLPAPENSQLPGSELNKNTRGGILSTPAVRHLARQYGIDLNDVQGSGKDGRILRDDVIKYAIQKGIVESSSDSSGDEENNQHSSAEVKWQPDDKVVPLRGFQRTMVKTMSMAAKVPHFHYVEEINCDALIELKESFQNNNSDSNIKYTFLPILIKSLSMALGKYPYVNSCFNEESVEVILKGSHNIGIAMATPNGLVVPNIKNVQALSIMEIAKELSRLQNLAKENKLSHIDITGGTITLSNIGAIGGKFGSPLLNLPEVAIIAMGRIQQVAQFSEEGDVYPVSTMTVNIGADHRVLDGATVARFCNEWKHFIENPEFLTLQMR